MAYKFTEKRNSTQEEITYIIYMMISSYFHKETCRSKMMADRLFLYYKEMKERNQINQERKVAMRVEHDLKDLADSFSIMNCESSIEAHSGKYYLVFFTGFENVYVEIDEKGRWELSVSD